MPILTYKIFLHALSGRDSMRCWWGFTFLCPSSGDPCRAKRKDAYERKGGGESGREGGFVCVCIDHTEIKW